MHFIRIRFQSVSPCISCVVDADLTVVRLKNLDLGVMCIWVLLSRIIICGRMYWFVIGGIWRKVDCIVMRCFNILVNILRSSIIASHARDGSFSSFQQSCNFLPQRKDQGSQQQNDDQQRHFLLQLQYSKQTMDELKQIANEILSFSFRKFCSQPRDIQQEKWTQPYIYTHLNNRNSDKYSEVQSNISTKEPKMNRLRQSKSPNKKINMELGTCIVFLRIVICVVQSQICESIVLSEFASSWIYQQFLIFQIEFQRERLLSFPSTKF